MDRPRLAIAQALLERSRKHDAQQQDRLARYRNLEPDSARLLHLLLVASRPARALELGTSNGYSTLWLGDACERVGASLTSVDVDGRRLDEAAEALRAAGLAVELRAADAADVLRETPDDSWDFIFLDAERPAYAGDWPDLLRALAPGAMLAIDNVLSHAHELKELTALIEAEARVLTSVVPVGAGLRLVVKTAPVDGPA